MTASVIIPIHNQKNALIKCILGFQKQFISNDITWEIIIVDDGSTDSIKNEPEIETILKSSAIFSYKIITINHSGRSVARNVAIKESEGGILIFCDGDRIPDRTFVQRHIDTLRDFENAVCIGNAKDYWRKEYLFQDENKKFSRNTTYFNCVLSLYTETNGKGYKFTSSNLAWLSLLIGNASVHRSVLDDVGYFDEDFISWGFEHFELGLRLQQRGVLFVVNEEIISYHQVHSHKSDEVFHSLELSLEIISKKHKDIDVDMLKKFFMGEISIQKYQKKLGENVISKTEKKVIKSPWKERDNYETGK